MNPTPRPPAAPKLPSADRVNSEGDVLVQLGEDYIGLDPRSADKTRAIVSRIAGNYRALAAERETLRGLLEGVPAQVRRVSRATPPGERKRMANDIADKIEAALAAE